MTDPSLAELLDAPTITVPIGGRDYRFSEVPIESLAALEGWIRANTPHPVQSIKPFLDGLPAEERQGLLERARQDARDWPPRVGTRAGSVALLGGGDMGQIEVLYHGLLVHHPSATREHARGLYRRLTRLASREVEASLEGESTTVRRIYAAIFGMLDEQGEPASGLPKGETAPIAESGGTSSSGAPSSD